MTDIPFMPPAGDPYNGAGPISMAPGSRPLANSEVLPVDPTTHLAAILDARIDTKLGELVVELRAEFDKLYQIVAEVAAGEVGDAYRAFVVSEARRLQVRASEVIVKGENGSHRAE